MPDKVADASIVAAMAFDEPEGEEAVRLTSGFQLHAPVLIDYELASITRTKIVREPDQRQRLMGCLADALGLAMERHEVAYEAVVDIALDTGLSTYDASYLYLARQLGVPLVTFDRRLRTAAGEPDL